MSINLFFGTWLEILDMPLGTELELGVKGGRSINKKTASSLGEYSSHDLKRSYSYQEP